VVWVILLLIGVGVGILCIGRVIQIRRHSNLKNLRVVQVTTDLYSPTWDVPVRSEFYSSTIPGFKMLVDSGGNKERFRTKISIWKMRELLETLSVQTLKDTFWFDVQIYTHDDGVSLVKVLFVPNESIEHR
jgi:hypothetical protein